MIALKVVGKESKQEILPCLWSDNYLILFPGESKIVQVELDKTDLMNEVPEIEYTTYGKLKKQVVEIRE
jgi:hypothetical protein